MVGGGHEYPVPCSSSSGVPDAFACSQLSVIVAHQSLGQLGAFPGLGWAQPCVCDQLSVSVEPDGPLSHIWGSAFSGLNKDGLSLDHRALLLVASDPSAGQPGLVCVSVAMFHESGEGHRAPGTSAWSWYAIPCVKARHLCHFSLLHRMDLVFEQTQLKPTPLESNML